MNFKLSAAICLLLSFTSCSLKENRCNCPCYMIINFDKVDTTAILSAKLSLFSDYNAAADSFEFSKELGLEDFRKPLVVEVPRTNIHVCVLSGVDGAFSPKEGLKIPLGQECPPVYMHNIFVNTEYDTITDSVKLAKSFCVLTVGMIADGKSKAFDVGVKGNVCGYSDTGAPVEGDFLVVSDMPSGGHATVRLPRQIDASLALQIYDEGKVIREFALGEYIAKSGYDWGAENLGDVDVTVDFALAEVTVKIDEWETRYVYGVEI